MNCCEIEPLLGEYVDGELETARRALVLPAAELPLAPFPPSSKCLRGAHASPRGVGVAAEPRPQMTGFG